MNKKNTNSFVAHLEDKEELLEEMDREHKKQIALQEETLDKMDQYQKAMIGVYVVVGVLLLGIAFFWWNISRGQFYAALNKPFDNSAVEGLLIDINKAKEDQGELIAADDIDWNALLEEIKAEKGEELTKEDEAILLHLVDQLEEGKSLQDVIDNLDQINFEE